MAEFLYFNSNPAQKYKKDGTPMKWNAGDCVVRAISKALDISWEDAYKKLAEEGLKQHKMPNDGDGSVYGKVLEDNGFKKGVINKEYIKQSHHRPTVESALKDAKKIKSLKDKKKFVFKTTHHLTCSDDGVIMDTWDTSGECVWQFWYK